MFAVAFGSLQLFLIAVAFLLQEKEIENLLNPEKVSTEFLSLLPMFVLLSSPYCYRWL